MLAMKNPIILPALFLLLTIGLGPGTASAQDLNDPAKILEVMENSKVSYQVQVDEAYEADPIEKGKNNQPYTYQKIVDGQPTIASYEVDSVIKPLYVDAEKAFGEGDYAGARGKYLQIHELHPDMGVIVTYIGQTYESEKNFPEAVKWFKKAIEINFHDYMAHWFLADVLLTQKKEDEAAEEIALAYVLNRNHPAIHKALTVIFKEAGLKLDDFEFLPQYSLRKAGANVEIRFQQDWMMYAFCKALWKYEPNYHRELGGGRPEFNMDEEKECLLNLAIGYERVNKGKKGKNEVINAVLRAVEQKYSTAFIFTEIWLQREPLIIYTQSKEAVQELAQYVLKVRGGKK
jgi:tetratricopeptide (TPR) repeat protein